MSICIACIHIMQVVCHHQGNLYLMVHLVEQLIEFALGRWLSILESALVLLYLEIEVLPPEYILVPARRLVSLFSLFTEQHFRNLTREAGGGNNQTLRVLFQHALINTWPEMPSLGIGDSRQLHPVVIARLIFRQ